MTSEEIRPLISKLQQEKDQIEQQVTTAKRGAKASGIYADGRWLASAEYAAKAKGRQISQLQQQLGAAIKAEKAAAAAVQHESFAAEFMRQAMAVLPRDMYDIVIHATIDATRGSAMKRSA